MYALDVSILFPFVFFRRKKMAGGGQGQEEGHGWNIRREIMEGHITPFIQRERLWRFVLLEWWNMTVVICGRNQQESTNAFRLG